MLLPLPVSSPLEDVSAEAEAAAGDPSPRAPPGRRRGEIPASTSESGLAGSDDADAGLVATSFSFLVSNNLKRNNVRNSQS